MNRLLVSSFASLAAALLLTSTAAADPKTHDGFFLRTGLNLGYTSASKTVEGSMDSLYDSEATKSGMGLGFDFLLGGTLAPGFTLGGGLMYGNTPAPRYQFRDYYGDSNGTSRDAMILLGVTLFGNYYFDPAHGGHAQLMLGYATLYFNEFGLSEANRLNGPLFGIGGGYDFWVGNEWSIGPFLRIVYVVPSYDEPDSKTSASYFYPSIGASFTLH